MKNCHGLPLESGLVYCHDVMGTGVRTGKYCFSPLDAEGCFLGHAMFQGCETGQTETCNVTCLTDLIVLQ